MIRVEDYLGESAFSELEGHWRTLHEEAGAVPFLSPSWLRAWHRHLAPGLRPRLVAAWDRGGKLTGLLPLFEEEVAIGGLPLGRRLGFLGEKTGGADYLDLLALPASRGEVAEALITHLMDARGFDLVDLYELPAGSSLLPALSRQAGEGATMEIEARYVCPQVELEGSWEAIMARSRRASNYRRRRRQAEAMGATHRSVRDPAEAGVAFERFLRLHELRWEREGGSDGIRSPAHRAFHRALVEDLARRGWLRFEELWIEGACRASIYGIEAGETFYFYQSGFDPAWASRSVGLVLLGMSLEQAVRRGLRVYDFLHGVESYKLDWATRATQTLRLRLAQKTAGAAYLVASEGARRRARSWARALLPAEAVERLRRRRRAREARGEGEAWRGGTQPSAI